MIQQIFETMIKKFNEFVATNESLWKSGVVRAKTNNTRLGDVPQLSETKSEIEGYEIDGFAGWFFRIEWVKKKNFAPRIQIYNNDAHNGGSAICSMTDTKSNGYQKPFRLASYKLKDLTTTGEGMLNGHNEKRAHDIVQNIKEREEELGQSIDDMLKRLPDDAFKVSGITFNFEHKGYPVSGYKNKGYYFDFYCGTFNIRDDHYTIILNRDGEDIRVKVEQESGFGAEPLYKDAHGRYKIRSVPTIDRLVDVENGDKLTQEDKEEICSKKFISAINSTLNKIPIDDFE